jgi:hypothetical protein
MARRQGGKMTLFWAGLAIGLGVAFIIAVILNKFLDD